MYVVFQWEATHSQSCVPRLFLVLGAPLLLQDDVPTKEEDDYPPANV